LSWLKPKRYDFLKLTFDLQILSKNDDILDSLILDLFKNQTKRNESIYAFEWQSSCYLFNPHLDFKRDEFQEWPIPIIPNGDYYIFTNQNSNWGWLGHPWKGEIVVYGDSFIENIKENKRVFEDIGFHKDFKLFKTVNRFIPVSLQIKG